VRVEKEGFCYETVRRRYSEAVGQRLVALIEKDNASFLYGLGTMKNEKVYWNRVGDTIERDVWSWK